MNKKAFTLIEIALVLATISILILGVIQGSKLIDKAKLANARKMTDQSPIHSIQNGLVLWLETTTSGSLVNSNGSFDVRDNNQIQIWRNMIDGLSDLNAAQTTPSSQPLFQGDAINGLPALEFDGVDDFLIIPNNPSLETNNITVFIVAMAIPIDITNTLRSILTKGTSGGGSSNPAYEVRYNNQIKRINFLTTNSSGTSYASANTTILENIGFIFSAVHNSSNATSGLQSFFNGELQGSNATTNSIARNNQAITIARQKSTVDRYFSGYIGEVIFFNRALTTEEMKNIETYLSKKWRISLN